MTLHDIPKMSQIGVKFKMNPVSDVQNLNEIVQMGTGSFNEISELEICYPLDSRYSNSH